MKIFLVVLCRTVSSSVAGACTRRPWQIVGDLCPTAQPARKEEMVRSHFFRMRHGRIQAEEEDGEMMSLNGDCV